MADIGCHTLASAPLRDGEVLLSQGHTPSTGRGSPCSNGSWKVVSFFGDSTFFHAAFGVVNAVFNYHN